jgi:CheY-like chemotaxis protein
MVPIKILIVDDNEGDVFLFEESVYNVKNYLREKDISIDFSIKKASNGLDAISIIDKEFFDLIFLDLKMPKMNGIECLEKIRTFDKPFYVIIFTTSDYDSDIKKTLELGANGYLLKSLDILEFEEHLKSTLMVFIQNNFVYFNFIKDKYKNLKSAS